MRSPEVSSSETNMCKAPTLNAHKIEEMSLHNSMINRIILGVLCGGLKGRDSQELDLPIQQELFVEEHISYAIVHQAQHFQSSGGRSTILCQI